MKVVEKKLDSFVTKAEITDEFNEVRDKAMQASATCSVLAYKFDLMNELAQVNEVDKVGEALQNETSRLLQSFTPE